MSEKLYKWSISTVNTLRQCNRKYYFSSKLANYHHSNKLKRKAFELKKMQNILMWCGSVVDKIIETHVIPLIQDNAEIDFEFVADNAVELAKRRFEFSQDKIYELPDVSQSRFDEEYCVLDIHEVGKPYSEEELVSAYDRIRKSILNIPKVKLPDSDKLLFDYLRESKPLIPNVTTWSFEIENSRVCPQMDLILYNNFKPVVIDWKVSNSLTSDYSRQLIICGLTVFFTRMKKVKTEGKKPYSYSDIKLYEVNLFKGEMREHEFTDERANGMIDYINLTGSDMTLLANGMLDEDSDIEAFDIADDEGICNSCNFQMLCEYLLLNNNIYDEKSYTEFVQSKQLV